MIGVFFNRCLAVNKSLSQREVCCQEGVSSEPKSILIAFLSGRRVGLRMNQPQRAIVISRTPSNHSNSFFLTKSRQNRQNNVNHIPGDKVWVRKMTNILRLSSCFYLLKISNRNCSTAVDFVSRLPEAVFFRWPLVKENGAIENIVSLMINKLQENRSKDAFNVYFKVSLSKITAWILRWNRKQARLTNNILVNKERKKKQKERSQSFITDNSLL